MDDVPAYIRGGRIVPVYMNPGKNSIDTIVTNLTLIIAVDEKGYAQGSLYLDDGITFNFTEGEFIHRSFVFNNGSLQWRKVNQTEVRIPKLLQSAIVESIVIFDHSKNVTRIHGLQLKVCEEWDWPPPPPTPTPRATSPKPTKTSHRALATGAIIGISVGAGGLLIATILVASVIVRRRTGGGETVDVSVNSLITVDKYT
jgi:hypothetical protein